MLKILIAGLFCVQCIQAISKDLQEIKRKFKEHGEDCECFFSLEKLENAMSRLDIINLDLKNKISDCKNLQNFQNLVEEIGKKLDLQFKSGKSFVEELLSSFDAVYKCFSNCVDDYDCSRCKNMFNTGTESREKEHKIIESNKCHENLADQLAHDIAKILVNEDVCNQLSTYKLISQCYKINSY